MRQSGILLHMSSLPSPYGIGTLGKAAYRFIDFLKAAGQSCWQTLPINPTGQRWGNPIYDWDRMKQDGFEWWFAFDSRESRNYLPFTYTRNTVCYTGTHDNETLLQWQHMISRENLQYAMDYLQIKDENEIPKAMICCGMASVSDLFVAQMQDYLGPGAEARMNKPSTLNSQNWTWGVLDEQLMEELSEEIYRLTKLYGRYESDSNRKTAV